MKKALLIVNPVSGKQVAKEAFFDIVLALSQKYELSVHITKSSTDLVETARNCVCPTMIICGGDGTLSGAVQGLLENPHRDKIKLGYLPCGTANDVAHTLGIPKDITEAAEYVCKNKAYPHDIGMIGDKTFIYTASFGSFTKTSYSTPQEAKQLLGGLAYVLNGATELLALPSYDVTFEYDGGVIHNKDVTFCGISNTHFLGGGMIRYPSDLALLADGKFELLIISRPRNLIDLEEIVYAIAAREYNNDLVTLIQTSYVKIHSKTPIAYTIDGDSGGKYSDIEIKCLPSAISIIHK
ncbi:MAG: diacylglycerol kinase family lipid kinase [Clostridia bacterium]|nr:diacylglycerol kinase family lipid kinase [Clostridia bacterium]